MVLTTTELVELHRQVQEIREAIYPLLPNNPDRTGAMQAAALEHERPLRGMLAKLNRLDAAINATSFETVNRSGMYDELVSRSAR